MQEALIKPKLEPNKRPKKARVEQFIPSKWTFGFWRFVFCLLFVQFYSKMLLCWIKFPPNTFIRKERYSSRAVFVVLP